MEIFFIVLGAVITTWLAVKGIIDKNRSEEKNEAHAATVLAKNEEIIALQTQNINKSDELIELQRKLEQLNKKAAEDLASLNMAIPERITVGISCDLEDIEADIHERDWLWKDLTGGCLGAILNTGRHASAKQNLLGYLSMSKLEICIKFSSEKDYVEYYGLYPDDIDKYGKKPLDLHPRENTSLNKFLFNYHTIPPFPDVICFSKQELDIGQLRKSTTSLKKFEDGIITVDLKFNHCKGPVFMRHHQLEKDTFIKVEKLELDLKNEFKIFEIEEFKKEGGSNRFTSKIKIRDLN